MKKALTAGLAAVTLTASLSGCDNETNHNWDIQQVGSTPVLINHTTGALYVIDGGYKVAVQTVSAADLGPRSFSEPGVLGLPLVMHVSTVYRSGTLYWSADVSPRGSEGTKKTADQNKDSGTKTNASAALATWKQSVSKTNWMDRLKIRFSGQSEETIAESDIKPSNTTEITDSSGTTVAMQETGSVRVSPGEYKSVFAVGLVYSGK